MNWEMTFYCFHPGIRLPPSNLWKNGSDKDLKLTPPHDISDRVITDYLPAGSDGSVLLDLMIRSEQILKTILWI